MTFDLTKKIAVFTCIISGLAFAAISPAAAADAFGGVFDPLTSMGQAIVDLLMGTGGRLLAIIIFVSMIVLVATGFRNFWVLFLMMVFIALFFGAPKIITGIATTVGTAAQ